MYTLKLNVRRLDCKMKDVVLDEVKKENDLQKFIMKRIEENKKLFKEDEIYFIKNNITIIKKIYILGIKDCKDTFKN